MMMQQGNRFLIFLLFVGLLLPAPVRAEVSAPVERVNAALLQAMRDADELGYKGRYAALAPVLSEAFNFRVMARISVGRHWKSLSEEQKDRLTAAFTRLSVGNFASRFDGYDGERFEIRGTREKRGGVVVGNELIPQSGEAVSIDYVVREYDGSWRIVDVHFDGSISQLAIRRSEFVSLIENEGFDALIAAMDQRVAAFKAAKQTARN